MTTARPAKTRDEGQWALGNREPLNANEEFKQAGPPLEVRERIENVYAKEGFDSIEKNDLRGRMRWWGLCGLALSIRIWSCWSKPPHDAQCAQSQQPRNEQ